MCLSSIFDILPISYSISAILFCFPRNMLRFFAFLILLLGKHFKISLAIKKGRPMKESSSFFGQPVFIWKLQPDPISSRKSLLPGNFIFNHVLQHAAVLLDHPRGADVLVIAGDQHAVGFPLFSKDVEELP